VKLAVCSVVQMRKLFVIYFYIPSIIGKFGWPCCSGGILSYLFHIVRSIGSYARLSYSVRKVSKGAMISVSCFLVNLASTKQSCVRQ
jgi:hypothetical protein